MRHLAPLRAVFISTQSIKTNSIRTFAGAKVARTNIEDCWWTDPRRSKLIKILGDEDRADGVAVKMWRLAQEFWKKDRGLVPKSIFETLENHQALVGAGLASLSDDGVYVRGSSQYLDWIHEQREKARKGGKESAKRPRDERGRLLKSDANIQAEAKQIQVSDSVSGSYSDSKEVVGQSAATAFPDNPKPNSSQNFNARFENPEAIKLIEFFNSQEILSDVRIFVPQIIFRWISFDNFMVFYNGIFSSPGFRKIDPDDKPARKRYFMAALSSELDMARKAAQ